jgi:hypothetical protein
LLGLAHLPFCCDISAKDGIALHFQYHIPYQDIIRTDRPSFGINHQAAGEFVLGLHEAWINHQAAEWGKVSRKHQAEELELHHAPTHVTENTVAVCNSTPNGTLLPLIGHQSNEDDDILSIRNDPSEEVVLMENLLDKQQESNAAALIQSWWKLWRKLWWKSFHNNCDEDADMQSIQDDLSEEVVRQGSDAGSQQHISRHKPFPFVLSKQERSRATSGSTHSVSKGDLLPLKRSSSVFRVPERIPAQPEQNAKYMKSQYAIALVLAGGIQKNNTTRSTFLPVLDLPVSDAILREELPVLCRSLHSKQIKRFMADVFALKSQTPSPARHPSMNVYPNQLSHRHKKTSLVRPSQAQLTSQVDSDNESQYDESDRRQYVAALRHGAVVGKKALALSDHIDQTKLDKFAQLPEPAVSHAVHVKNEFNPEDNPFIDTAALDTRSRTTDGDNDEEYEDMIPVTIIDPEEDFSELEEVEKNSPDDDEDDDDDDEDNDDHEHNPIVKDINDDTDDHQSGIADHRVAAPSMRSWLRKPSVDEGRRANAAMNTLGERTDVLHLDGTDSIQRLSMHTLNPKMWLNDEIIHFFVKLLLKQDTTRLTRSFIFKSFFITSVLQEGNSNSKEDGKYSFDRVKKWHNKVPGKWRS